MQVSFPLQEMAMSKGHIMICEPDQLGNINVQNEWIFKTRKRKGKNKYSGIEHKD